VSRVLLAMLAAPGLGLAAADHDSDDASARRQAMYEWYTDDYSHHGEPGFTNQKPMYFPAEYERFLHAAAQRERQRYAALLPGGGASKSMINSPQAAFSTGSWLNIGPNNANFEQNGGTLTVTDSGRVNVVIVDPNNTNIIYVGFSGGGVWKSTDGGSTWTPKTETLGSLSVGTLEMDPSNSSTLYLGLGDPFDGTGIGLVKSTDGGDTWSDVVYLGDSSIIADIEVSRSNPLIVLAATNTGLYRSTDGGATFNKVSIATGQAADPFVWTLAWGGGDTFVLGLEAAYANLGTGTSTLGQVWRSTDNGATWTQSTGVTDSTGIGRLYIAAAPSNRSILYAEAANTSTGGSSSTDLANFFKSTDNGVTWTGIGRSTGTKYKQYTNKNTESSTLNTILNGQGWYNQLVLVDPTNANVAYFGGALLAAKTSDGGTSFSEVSNWLAQFSLPYVHADFHGGTIAADGSLYFGTDGGIFRSTDSGATFTSTLNKGIASMLVYQVGSSQNNTSAAIVGLQDNGTRVRVGSTATFNQIIGGDGFGCDVNGGDATKMLGSLYYDQIYKSTNSGTSFSAACSGITECNSSSNAPFHTMLSRWAGDATGNTLFTFSNFKAYKTTNYATSWTALGTAGLPASGSIFIRGIGAAKSSANTVGLVANSGRVFLTTDGTNWTQIGSSTSLPGNGLSLSWIAFDPTNASIIYVASVAPSLTANHLWRSIDSGTTWTAIDSAASGFPFGIPVNALYVDPVTPTTLYAATHLGVYASQDSGSTWTRWGSGMPLVNVTDLYVANDASTIRAATFGRSVWELSAAPTYTVGGSVNGLTTSGLVMAVTVPAGNQTMSVPTGATSYVFPTSEPNGSYTVSVKTQPTGQTCSVDNAGGTIAGANVTNANVTCTTNTYTLTPSVSGGHGTISPDTQQIVSFNATPSFTLTPDTGYHAVVPVGGNCGGQLSGSTYTTNAVTADCSVTATFAPNPPDHLVISSVSDGTAGAALGSFTVTVMDAGNVPVTGDANSVTLTIASGPGSSFDAASTNTAVFNNGVATFNNVIIDKAGSGYTLKATDSGDSLNVTSGSFNISAASAAALKFTPAPSDIVQGATLGNVTVTEVDAFNNVVADSSTQVTLTAGSCGGTALGNGTLNAGSITFATIVKFNTAAAAVSLSATANPSGPSSATTTFNVGAGAGWLFRGDFESCTP
jgi:hypothetical protein